MSSYVCYEKTYNSIYSGMQLFRGSVYYETQRAVENLLRFLSPVPKCDLDRYAAAVAAMYAVNVEAVNQRYADDRPALLTVDQLKSMCYLQADISIYQFVKCLECLHYQMCEGDIPQTSELYALVGNIISAACVDIVHTTMLYSGCSWG